MRAHLWGMGLFAAAALLLAAGGNRAQEPRVAGPAPKGDLYEALRDVINTGADLFNKQGDHAGCYRVYEGALLAVKPFLPADQQARVDQGFAAAARQAAFSERAFELRKVIDDIRAAAKPAVRVEPKVERKDEEKKVEEKKLPAIVNEEKKVDETKVEERKIEEKPQPPVKKVDEKKADEKKNGERGQVSGTVTLDGQPLPGGYLVTLVSDEGRKFSTALQKEGAFRYTTPIPPGRYRVVVEPFNEGAPPGNVNLPARYRSEETSGLSVQIAPGPNMNVALHLVK